jgi:hypothetical protein
MSLAYFSLSNGPDVCCSDLEDVQQCDLRLERKIAYFIEEYVPPSADAKRLAGAEWPL